MTKANDNSVRLTPRKSKLVDKLLGEQALLRQLVRACGSPLNILLPDQLAENLTGFQSVFDTHGLSGRLFFAHKCNQSDSLIAQLAQTSVSIDVASRDELRHALAAGFAGDRMEATGPKTPEFIALCLQHHLVINVDSLQELNDIEQVAAALGGAHTARVLLRLCGFSSPHTSVLSKQSRFGIRFADCQPALNVVAASSHLEMLGFAFHLDSTSIDERVVAIENCLTAIDQALALDLEPRVINIGGGFKVSYLEKEEEWNAFTSALKQTVLGSMPSITWQNNFFGLSSEGGVLKGKLNTYSYYEPRPGALFLDDLLQAQLPSYGDATVASVLRDNMIELWLEPGRALLDQCGVTLARVNSIKQSSTGDTLVGLSMKRQDVAFLDQEILVDPIVLPASRSGKRSSAGGSTPVFFTGNLCLESDLIFRRQVFLSTVPQPGDLVAFINTAAYMMDFSSTRSIMQPPARKIAVVQDNDQLVWMLDEQYTPVWQLHKRR